MAAIPVLQAAFDQCDARFRLDPRMTAIRHNQNLDAARIALYNRQITIGTYNQMSAQSWGNMQSLAVGYRAAPIRVSPIAPSEQASAPAAKSDGPARLEGTGSGFVVSDSGHIVTNAHVAEQCSERRVALTPGETVAASLVAADRTNDLALLRLPAPRPALVRFHAGKAVREGDPVVAVGYPLRSYLASGINLTTGTVSALAGLRNDARFYQMSTPVQPGNSGGPLLDMSGNLVGVVSAKINAVAVAQRTGDIPQNINFAIKESVLRDFLVANGVEPVIATATPSLSAADIGDRAKTFTFLIECWR